MPVVLCTASDPFFFSNSLYGKKGKRSNGNIASGAHDITHLPSSTSTFFAPRVVCKVHVVTIFRTTWVFKSKGKTFNTVTRILLQVCQELLRVIPSMLTLNAIIEHSTWEIIGGEKGSSMGAAGIWIWMGVCPRNLRFACWIHLWKKHSWGRGTRYNGLYGEATPFSGRRYIKGLGFHEVKCRKG